MTNKVYSRFSKISNGQVSDSSDEYYTLYHAYCSLVLELMCRYKKGKKYKVIICPCDSSTSIFRNLEKIAGQIGNPKVIYSFYPEVDWSYYFDLNYEKEYGCTKDEVLIFTNPPFKKLSKNLELIKCDYLLFGSNAVGIPQGVYAKETKGFVYIKTQRIIMEMLMIFSKNLVLLTHGFIQIQNFYHMVGSTLIKAIKKRVYFLEKIGCVRYNNIV